MFSKTFGYALRAVVFVARHEQEGRRVGLLELSKGLEAPHHFLGKIMQNLVRHDVLDSSKGPNGGFYLNARSLGIALTDILRITDGSLAFEQCALGLKRCNPDKPCLLHHDFALCRNGMLQLMAEKTIGDLLGDVLAHKIFLGEAPRANPPE